MPFENDDAIFYSDFKVPAVFTLSDDSEISVEGIFTEGSDATVQFGVEIEAVEPNIVCPTNDITELAAHLRGATAEIDVNDTTRNFSVERIQKTGTGDSVVFLQTA